MSEKLRFKDVLKNIQIKGKRLKAITNVGVKNTKDFTHYLADGLGNIIFGDDQEANTRNLNNEL